MQLRRSLHRHTSMQAPTRGGCHVACAVGAERRRPRRSCRLLRRSCSTPSRPSAVRATRTSPSPPPKLVLIENPEARGDGVAGALNHLGVEVSTPTEVTDATRRLAGEGLETLTQDATACCYAVQDKVWVHDPDGAPWEVYTVLADASAAGDLAGASGCSASPDGACLTASARTPAVFRERSGRREGRSRRILKRRSCGGCRPWTASSRCGSWLAMARRPRTRPRAPGSTTPSTRCRSARSACPSRSGCC